MPGATAGSRADGNGEGATDYTDFHGNSAVGGCGPVYSTRAVFLNYHQLARLVASMRADLFWVEGFKLAIMPRPRGGEWLADEVASLNQQGVRVLVSLLEEAEVRELDLCDEAKLAAEAGLEFHSCPIADRGVPSDLTVFENLMVALVDRVRHKIGVAVHCRAGIGRSAIVAATVLARLNVAMEEAFRMLAKARRVPVPDTEEQRQWAMSFVRRFRS